MKQKLCVSVLVCVLFSFSTFAAKAQSSHSQDALLSPDIKIRGFITDIQSDYHGYHGYTQGVWSIFTAKILVLLNETLEKPEAFPSEIAPGVDVLYNYTSPLEAKVNDFVEVYGLWLPNPDVPWGIRIRVDDYVVGSYVRLLSHPPLPTASIDTQSEYSNGSIAIAPYPLIVMDLWYDWINVGGTQVIFIAYHSRAYNSPFISFVGQRYAAPDGTEVFMGNTLSLMEVYKDFNENNAPDMSETSYFFIVNSSREFTPTPIEKVVVGEVAHYRWGVRYQTIDGYLFQKNGTLGSANVIVDSMAFSYDYYIQGNASYLKTDFEIGNITSIEPHDLNLTLQGFSLSLLYSTMTVTSKSYTVLVNEQTYNSTTALVSTIPTNRTEVRIGNQKTYEFVFGENYTRYKDSLIESYKSFSVAVSTDTIPPYARSLSWLLQQLEGVLNDIFPKISAMRADINLDYVASTFVYRVGYPTWEGYRIKHDPTYIAYINPEGIGLPTISISPPLELLTAAIIIGSIALIAAVYELRKIRRRLQPFSPHVITRKY